MEKQFYNKTIQVLMYTQRFCDTRITKITLTVMSVIVAIIGIIHYVFAGIQGTLLNFYKDSFFGLDSQLFQRLFAPPIAYFSIAGTTIILVNVFYIMLIWEIVKVTALKMKIILGLLMVEFGMKFLIAVCCAFWWTYYELLFKTYFEWTDAHLSGLDSRWRKFVISIINMYRCVIAQTILGFLVALPIVIIQLLMIHDKNTSYAYLQEAEKDTKVHPRSTDLNISN